VRFHNPAIPVRAVCLAAAIAMMTALGGPVAASADNSISIDIISQQDPAWAGAPLGSSATETIGSAGCAITAVTMMLRYYGLTTDPGAFNAWLTANGGYAFDDQLIWAAVTGYANGRLAFSGWLGPDLGVIKGELDEGRPVVAEVLLYGNQHFILLTGYTSDDGLLINDPWFADGVRLRDRYADPAILSIRTFMPAETVGRSGDGRVSGLATAVAAARLGQ